MGKSGLIGDYRSCNIYGRNEVANKIKETLEADVQDILQSCLKEVKELLHKHKDLLKYFTEELVKKEELEYDEIQAIFDKFGVVPLSGRSPIRDI